MGTLERGFKSWAERVSVGFRRDLGLKPSDPLSPKVLSDFLSVKLLTPNDIPGLPTEYTQQLLVTDKHGWSALSLVVNEHFLVIYNPVHSNGRISSDIMHELAHIIRGHEPTRLIMSSDGGMALRTFDQQQEDEANWLGGCLLLPRDALLAIKNNQLPETQACSTYGVSKVLLTFRLNMSGVNHQFKRLLSKRL